MTDEELIRRGDAFAVVKGLRLLEEDIRNLPAVTVGVPCTWPLCKCTAKGQCRGTGVCTVAAPVTHLGVNKGGVIDDDVFAWMTAPDPAAIREAALREAAAMVEASAMHGGDDGQTLLDVRDAILALIGDNKHD